MRSTWITLILTFVFAVASGQDTEETLEDEVYADTLTMEHALVPPEMLETTRNYQSEDVVLRKFDKATWKEIVAGVDYQEEPVKLPDFGGMSIPWAGPVIKVIAYLVIGSLIVILLFYITKNIVFKPGIVRSGIQSENLEHPVEDIEELDIEALLEQARKQGNFKMAVRFYYLRLLKKLNALGMINWKKDKTNRDYLSELFTRDFHFQEIRRLTHSYEAVWYGEHPLHDESFRRICEHFDAVDQKISSLKSV